MLLIVAYDWTDWLALGLMESASLAVLIMFLFQAPISDWRASRRLRKDAEWRAKQRALRRKAQRKGRVTAAIESRTVINKMGRNAGCYGVRRGRHSYAVISIPSGETCPWMNKEIRLLRIERVGIFRQAVETRAELWRFFSSTL